MLKSDDCLYDRCDLTNDCCFDFVDHVSDEQKTIDQVYAHSLRNAEESHRRTELHMSDYNLTVWCTILKSYLDSPYRSPRLYVSGTADSSRQGAVSSEHLAHTPGRNA